MKSFTLENVKAFKNTDEISLKPINIFVGKNSSGKSSLLRFPVMLSQTFSEDVITPFLFFGNQIDYGNFEDVVHNQESDTMSFSFNFEKKEIVKYGIPFGFFKINKHDFKKLIKDINTFSIKVTIMKYNRKIIVKEFDLFFDEINVVRIEREKKNKYRFLVLRAFKNYRISDDEINLSFYPEIEFRKFIPIVNMGRDELINLIINRMDCENYINSNEIFQDIITEGVRNGNINISDKNFAQQNLSLEEEHLIKEINKVHFIFQIYNYITRSVYRAMRDFANSLSYIGPFRKDPERIYRDSESSFMNVGKNGENVSKILRQGQQGNNGLLEKVSNFISDSMGYKLDIEEIEHSNLYKLIVQTPGSRINQNIIDVGYGISQVLPIVTQVFYEKSTDEEINRFTRNRNNIVIIEQPELHLHPAAQSSLADLFVNKVIENKKSKFLIETHSEHFIRKLQVLIADPNVNITENDIAIYYVDKVSTYSTIKEMELTEQGQFKERWPSGFFDKSFQLSRELIGANNRRGSTD